MAYCASEERLQNTGNVSVFWKSHLCLNLIGSLVEALGIVQQGEGRAQRYALRRSRAAPSVGHDRQPWTKLVGPVQKCTNCCGL